jgi:2-(1,2-epoxy-1,2-dihydrophenyl)acetyl-CoA isomerase
MTLASSIAYIRGVSIELRDHDVSVVIRNHSAVVEIHRPPNNFFDVELVRALADTFEALDGDARCRAVVLCSEGKNFCAGAGFSETTSSERAADPYAGVPRPSGLYDQAVRLMATRKPIIAAVQGAAVGGGLGLACVADFRIASPQSRFSANFARLGFHHGFGLSVTLPALVGPQRCLELLYTGRRISGDDAFAIGLCDRLVAGDEIRAVATQLAAEIALSAPLAVQSIRQTMRRRLLEEVRLALPREQAEQARLRGTSDWQEGVRAYQERRIPHFAGR